LADPTTPTDAELDAFIQFRLGMLGIDLSVLPVNDPSAPADQVRAFSSMRSTLRNQIQLLEFPLDPPYTIATYYASPQLAWTDPESDPHCLRKNKPGKGKK
jgi:hypothetical protein